MEYQNINNDLGYGIAPGFSQTLKTGRPGGMLILIKS